MKRYLILQNGDIFEGYGFGSYCEKVGELVFTTGMCGYTETLTDPSYFGQTVLFTFPPIGNYGVNALDFEGKCRVSGCVVREYCEKPSGSRDGVSLDEFLKQNGVPGIYGVDTREITRTIRECGVMNAVITDTPTYDINLLNSYTVKNAVSAVSTSESVVIPSLEKTIFRVALIDYGAKQNILSELLKRGCEVTKLPCLTSAKAILDGGFDGIMLSNGPGDPTENTDEIAVIGGLFGKLPIFGICLGHQLMALSQGAQTVKLKYGHRGVNQPVRETRGERTYITSQNHGYAVDESSIKHGTVSFVNANDKTVEGIDYDDAMAFSVQFHPEGSAGPHDTSFLFDRFCDMMGGK